jgi:hypothetical protein
MLDGVAHGRALVNGDSGFVPRPYARLRELLDGPLEDALPLLRAIGTRHVVSASDQPLPLVAAFGTDRVYEVPPGDVAAVPVAQGPASPTVWTTDAVIVDLGEARAASRVLFELDDRPWLDRPTLSASVDGVSWTPLETRASLADATLALYRDPRHGRGEVRFPPTTARWLRVDPGLPARPGALGVPP